MRTQRESVVQCFFEAVEGGLEFVLSAPDLTTDLCESAISSCVGKYLSSLFGHGFAVSPSRYNGYFTLPDALQELLQDDECSLQDYGYYRILW
ncbi:MAG: hypothetical protein KBC05_20785 [Candidatus Hydrogenedentes bacterium]|nr:hypothetical protein [Candidatus Hydrogenedentota bacterium]